MKKNIIWMIGALLLLAGCLDDENNYDYHRINTMSGYKVLNLESRYTCFQNEELFFEPKVRFSIDSLNPDISYEWYVGDVVKSTEPTYRFVAERSGDVKMVFCSIDNKTGVRFPMAVTITVISKYLKGWMILSSPEGTDQSQLSMVMMKEQKTTRMEDGEEVTLDTVVYTGEEINIFPDLGFEPRKLTENFTYDENGIYPEQLGSEIVVVQRDKCVELNGNTLGVMAYPEDEFIGQAPNGFEPTDAAGNYACRYLLNKDGYLYFAHNAMILDLHAGRYLPDPAFGGRKIKALTPAHKLEGSHEFGLVLDENNTFFGIIHRVGHNDDFMVTTSDRLGLLVEITGEGYDLTRFREIPGEVLYTGVEEYDDDAGGYISFIEQDGQYYAHHYELYMNRKPPLEVVSSHWNEVNSAMFTNFKDAAVFHHKNYVVVANSQELWHYDFNEGGDPGKLIKRFDKAIVSVNSKDFSDRSDQSDVAHLGVALEGGEFYIFELSYPDEEDISVVNMLELYHHAGFGDIKHVLYKYGRAYDMYE